MPGLEIGTNPITTLGAIILLIAVLNMIGQRIIFMAAGIFSLLFSLVLSCAFLEELSSVVTLSKIMKKQNDISLESFAMSITLLVSIIVLAIVGKWLYKNGKKCPS